MALWVLLFSTLLLLPSGECSPHTSIELNSPTSILLSNNNLDCNAASYFKVEAKYFCKDLTIQVNNVINLNSITIIASSSPAPSLKDKVWMNVDPLANSLIIPARDPEYRAGTIYIGIFPTCNNNNNNVDANALTSGFTVTVMHTQPQPRSGVVALTENQISTFSLSRPNDYWPFEFCTETVCSDITLNMNDPDGFSTACPIPIVSDLKFDPQRKDFAWSTSCGPLTISAFDSFRAPGYYFGNLNSWCTPNEFCTNPSTCYPCSVYSVSNPVMTNLSFTTSSYDVTRCLNNTASAMAQSNALSDPSIKPISWNSNNPLQFTASTPLDTINCSAPVTKYYYLSVVNPCMDLTVNLLQPRGQTNILISRLPIQHPSYSTIIWADWWWGNNSVTISHEDQDFVPGIYTIAIVPYCSSDATTYDPNPTFYISATLTLPADSYSVNTYGQVSAGKLSYVHLCVPPSLVSSTNYLSLAFTDIGSGTPSVGVSTIFDRPDETVRTFNLDFPLNSPNSPRNQLVLWNANNSNRKPISGVLYVGVYGRCYPSFGCASLNFPGCSPCSNFPSNFMVQLISSPPPSSSSGTVAPVISQNFFSSNSSYTFSGSDFAGLIVGIVLAVIVIELAGVCLFSFVQHKRSKSINYKPARTNNDMEFSNRNINESHNQATNGIDQESLNDANHFKTVNLHHDNA